MLSVEQAQAQLLALCSPLEHEKVPLAQADGRILAAPVIATRTQPPFATSAMDGYAVRFADIAAGARWQVIGEAAAGHGFAGSVKSNQAVRIFTGAPVPSGADTILLQEDARREDDEVVMTGDGPGALGRHIRPAGLDFKQGDTLIASGTVLTDRHIGLVAAANCPQLPVARQPTIALLSTGDELVPVGQTPGPNQIISSNGLLIASLARKVGAQVTDLGIVPDRMEALMAALEQARHADLVVTIGGASVGDHDLVQQALMAAGASIDFWRIAMKPGKPMMAGQLGDALVLGLPGNPVSAYVCAVLFLKPALAALQGAADPLPKPLPARAGCAIPAGGRRAEYLRATVQQTPQGTMISPLPVQDSAMLGALARADGLLVRPVDAPALSAGDPCSYLPL